MKKQRKQRKKLPSMKKMMENADRAFSIFIRTRDKWRCVICGSTKQVQCGHIIRRGKMNVRFNEDNCHAQCFKCNCRHEYWPEHYMAWFLDTIGPSSFHTLYLESLTPRRFNREQLQRITDKYLNAITQEARNRPINLSFS